MIVFPLTLDEIDLARKIGRQRNEIKVRQGITTHKHAPASDESIHVLGAMAEIVVCRWLGVLFNDSITPCGDGGLDLTWGGLKVDVKMRSEWGRDLLILPDLSDFRADIAMLCWPGKEPDTVAVVGLVSRERFRQKARSDLLVRPPRLVMPWQELTKISS